MNVEKLIIPLPPSVRRILDRLREEGFEAYIVGGCVRDAILDKEPKDWDITTSALPEQVKSLFSNTVDTGIRHGTVMVLMKGTGYEVTTYRVDGEYKDGRHPEHVVFTRSLKEDLKRRDFTINAFAYDPESGIVDLFDGLSDIEKRLIRCVGDPDERFGEDALRIMRAIRFSAQLSFQIEKHTEEAVRRHAKRLSLVSVERIRDEFEKTLLSDNPEAVNLYGEMGMGSFLIPEPELCRKCFIPELSGLYRLAKGEKEQIRILRLAFFFSNLSHEEVRRALRKLKYDNKTIGLVSGIIENAKRMIPADKQQIRKILHETGEEIFDYLLSFQEAELRVFGKEPEKKANLENLEQVRKAKGEILDAGEAFSLSALAVNGTDLIRNGFSPGKEIGGLLNWLLEAVMEDPSLNQKETLLQMAGQWEKQ